MEMGKEAKAMQKRIKGCLGLMASGFFGGGGGARHGRRSVLMGMSGSGFCLSNFFVMRFWAKETEGRGGGFVGSVVTSLIQVS